MKEFVKIYPEAQTLPFFVFCESYGGKMVIQFANSLLQAISAGDIDVNFRGVALGDSWISPIDFVDTWGPLLRSISLMEEQELETMNQQAVYPCDQAVANQQWTNATNYWGTTENIISQYSCVDFYNFLQVDCGSGNEMRINSRNSHPSPALLSKPLLSPEALAMAPEGIDHDILESLYRRHVHRFMDEDITTFMNTVVRPQLKIIPDNVTWGGQSGNVFSTLSGDFMRPVIDVVDTVLSLNKINVTIYEGQLDLICATVGADRWMTKLQWPGMVNFNSTQKVPLSPFPGGPTGAFKRSYDILSYYKIMMAGHMVPGDNGDMALVMVQDILNSQS
jgi:serine carboxypeptidase 1